MGYSPHAKPATVGSQGSNDPRYDWKVKFAGLASCRLRISRRSMMGYSPHRRDMARKTNSGTVFSTLNPLLFIIHEANHGSAS